MKTIKKLGTITNGDTIEFEGRKIVVSGIWQNTKVQLKDNDGISLYGYYLIGKGGAFNGTLYDAAIVQDKKHPIFNCKRSNN